MQGLIRGLHQRFNHLAVVIARYVVTRLIFKTAQRNKRKWKIRQTDLPILSTDQMIKQCQVFIMEREDMFSKTAFGGISFHENMLFNLKQ